MNYPNIKASSEFTYSAYKNLVNKLLNAGYHFENFSDVEKLLESKKSFILMRHDIDFDLEKALKLAQIEDELNIHSTYFIMIRSDFYNIFSKKNSDIIHKILKLGHRLGLHFDCAAYENLDAQQINTKCNQEIELINSWFETNIDTISFHRPNEVILNSDINLTAPYYHTYAPIFTKEVHYCSDSMGYWRFGDPLKTETFQNREPLHLLIHPIWWNDDKMEPLDSLHTMLEHKNDLTTIALSENSKLFNHKPKKV